MSKGFSQNHIKIENTIHVIMITIIKHDFRIFYHHEL